VNGAPVSAPILAEICDFEKMPVRHGNHESRIGAGDDLALERTGESTCWNSEKRESDEIVRGEHFHGSRHVHNLYFATEIIAGCSSKAHDYCDPVWHSAIVNFRAAKQRWQ
jgi:hypothetical protein